MVISNSLSRFITTGSIQLNLLFAPQVTIHERLRPNLLLALGTGMAQGYLWANDLINWAELY